MVARATISFTLRNIFDRVGLASLHQPTGLPFQSLAKDACGGWRLVGILEPRMAQRSSIARPTRAIPPVLPRLRRGYPA